LWKGSKLTINATGAQTIEPDNARYVSADNERARVAAYLIGEGVRPQPLVDWVLATPECVDLVVSGQWLRRTKS
jgi:hypothetical protein